MPFYGKKQKQLHKTGKSRKQLREKEGSRQGQKSPSLCLHHYFELALAC
jgi:hypothetical protein